MRRGGLPDVPSTKGESCLSRHYRAGNATQARDIEGLQYRYSEWATTPVPPMWVREGSWMMCPDIGRRLHQRIVDAARKEGAFFATLPEGELVVIPELELIVFSFNG